MGTAQARVVEISTEPLLTSPDAFGITTAMPAQRAIWRVLDGVPLAELAAHAGEHVAPFARSLQ